MSSAGNLLTVEMTTHHIGVMFVTIPDFGIILTIITQEFPDNSYFLFQLHDSLRHCLIFHSYWSVVNKWDFVETNAVHFLFCCWNWNILDYLFQYPCHWCPCCWCLVVFSLDCIQFNTTLLYARCVCSTGGIMAWKHFQLYWTFVMGNSPVTTGYSHIKGTMMQTFMLSLLLTWTRYWSHKIQFAHALRCHDVHVIVL